MNVVSVDVGKRKRKSVACLLSTSTDGGVRIDGWIELGDNLDVFCKAVAKMAADAGASVVVEDQFVKFVPAAKKLIEVRIWLRVRCLDVGVQVDDVLPQTWQTILKLSGIKGTRSNRKTKEKARRLAEMLWPRLHLSEDKIDAALIGVWRLRFARP